MFLYKNKARKQNNSENLLFLSRIYFNVHNVSSQLSFTYSSYHSYLIIVVKVTSNLRGATSVDFFLFNKILVIKGIISKKNLGKI